MRLNRRRLRSFAVLGPHQARNRIDWNVGNGLVGKSDLKPSVPGDNSNDVHLSPGQNANGLRRGRRWRFSSIGRLGNGQVLNDEFDQLDFTRDDRHRGGR
jgi:hypothetical protein